MRQKCDFLSVPENKNWSVGNKFFDVLNQKSQWHKGLRIILLFNIYSYENIISCTKERKSNDSSQSFFFFFYTFRWVLTQLSLKVQFLKQLWAHWVFYRHTEYYNFPKWIWATKKIAVKFGPPIFFFSLNFVNNTRTNDNSFNNWN